MTAALTEPCRRSKRWELSLSEGEGPESEPGSLPERSAPFHGGDGDLVTCLLRRGCRCRDPTDRPPSVSYIGRGVGVGTREAFQEGERSEGLAARKNKRPALSRVWSTVTFVPSQLVKREIQYSDEPGRREWTCRRETTQGEAHRCAALVAMVGTNAQKRKYKIRPSASGRNKIIF